MRWPPPRTRRRASRDRSYKLVVVVVIVVVVVDVVDVVILPIRCPRERGHDKAGANLTNVFSCFLIAILPTLFPRERGLQAAGINLINVALSKADFSDM
jgi:hypothetical protein